MCKSAEVNYIIETQQGRSTSFKLAKAIVTYEFHDGQDGEIDDTEMDAIEWLIANGDTEGELLMGNHPGHWTLQP